MSKRGETTGSVDAEEVARFAAMAAEWWDPDGKFRPLHKLNPARVRFIRDRACARFGRDPSKDKPLDGLRLIDIGCGGGLVCEPMARMGAAVTGIDAGTETVGIARTHAEAVGLDIDYRAETAEALVAAGETFDVVLSLEVVEHVADVAGFVAACCALTRPGGLIVMSTLNRTARAFATAIVGAEYVMRWLPRGTHDWRKFLRPSELSGALTRAGAQVEEVAGLSYNPFYDEWRVTGDVSVNYMIAAGKPAAA